MKLQLKRSNVIEGAGAKKPSADQLDYGELAVNYSDQDPALFIKDSNNAIRQIGADINNYYTKEEIDGLDFDTTEADKRYLRIDASAPDQTRVSGKVTFSAEVIHEIATRYKKLSALNDNYGLIAHNVTSTDDFGLELGHYAGGTDKTDARISIGGEGSNHKGYILLSTSNDDNADANTRVVVDPEGHLGVATSNPQTSLHVVSTEASVARFNATAGASSSVEGIGHLELGIDETSLPGAKISWHQDGLTGFQTELSFSTRGNTETDPVEALRIDQAGQIGVGTSTPEALLDVSGSARFRQSANDGQYIALESDANGNHIKSVSDDSDAGIVVSTNGVDHLEVTGTGDVRLLDLKNAGSLATDADGTIIEGASSVVIGETAPNPASEGDLWWADSDANEGGGRLYVYTGDEWVDTSLPGGSTDGSGGGGIEEAPNDGQQYARQNEAWSVVQASGGDGDTTTNPGLSAWGQCAGDGSKVNGLNFEVAKTGTGTYQITFDTPMPSADYSVTLGSYSTSANVGVSTNYKTATGFVVNRAGGDGSPSDGAFDFQVAAVSSIPLNGNVSEGTFTPRFATDNGAMVGGSYAHQVGVYQKVGNRVHFDLRIKLETKGTLPAGNLRITGLPYPCKNVGNEFGASPNVGYSRDWNSAIPRAAFLPGTFDFMFLYADMDEGTDKAGQRAPFQDGNLKDGCDISISGSYPID